MNDIKNAEQYFKSHQFARAIEVYERFLKDNPNHAIAYQDLGKCYLQVQHLDAAYLASMKAHELTRFWLIL